MALNSFTDIIGLLHVYFYCAISHNPCCCLLTCTLLRSRLVPHILSRIFTTCGSIALYVIYQKACVAYWYLTPRSVGKSSSQPTLVHPLYSICTGTMNVVGAYITPTDHYHSLRDYVYKMHALLHPLRIDLSNVVNKFLNIGVQLYQLMCRKAINPLEHSQYTAEC